jgi:hypothetical protein
MGTEETESQRLDSLIKYKMELECPYGIKDMKVKCCKETTMSS